MDSYAPLLEKTRVPQPSVQRFAVISIFSKLRSAPIYLGSESEPGRDTIFQCLHSPSPAVVDQSVREFCHLVSDSKYDLSRGLMELQSALDESDPKFVSLHVKGLGFLVRNEFKKKNGLWKFSSTENHPFVKILSCRTEVQTELVQQVVLFMAQNRRSGMAEVCEFLKPFLYFSILRTPFLDSSSTLFMRQLISSLASFCCSYPDEAMPVLKLLIRCLQYFPCRNPDDVRNVKYVVECIVDAYTVVLRHSVGMGLPITEDQLCGVGLLETVLSFCTSPHKQTGGSESIVEVLKRLVTVQKDLGLVYIPELSSAMLSLFIILIRSELEHEQLSILKFLHFLLKWKSENENVVGRSSGNLSEELLLIFPIINLMSSPSKSVKGAAIDLLAILEKLLVKLLEVPKNAIGTKEGYPCLSKPESIVFRLLQHSWFQDQHSLAGSSFLNLASSGGIEVKEMHNGPRSWVSQLREYSRCIFDGQKSSVSIFQSQELPLLLGAIASVLVMHPSVGSVAIDSLAVIGLMDSKLGVPLLLVVLFYTNIFTSKDVTYKNVLPKLLGVLPSLASQSVMIPFVVQTIIPMLRKDAKPVLYATAVRLLCHTWEINDRAFGSLEGILLPKRFADFMSDRHICISMAASIRDVCRKNPDRGVDLILSVSACIESQDSIVKALGFQSLSYLCEADVIDFYTAWDVIAKHVGNYSLDPVLAHSLCLLLRWGALDAEAYPESSGIVLKILWEIGSGGHLPCDLQWSKARAAAFEALSQFEVSYIERNISDFKKTGMELLFLEANSDVLRALEGFQLKIITQEHILRRRFVKEKKVPGSKIEKLLDVFPQIMFSSGKRKKAGELPGAALLCLSFSPRDVNNQGASRGLQGVHAEYEDALMEIASSLQLSRNIFVALFSLQSWKSFMRRWMRANILAIDTKTPTIASDKTSKAANDILKSLIRIAEESVPRSAENVALAVGALCAVLPASAHTIKSAASKFLLRWLFCYEHEHRQWSAAISLGLISSLLHVTDHKQKFQNISGLLEVLCGSKSTLVKGACGIGLGISCQDLLTRVEAADIYDLDKQTYEMQEERLLGRIVRMLSLLLCKLDDSSSKILESLSLNFPGSTDDIGRNFSELSCANSDDLEDDIWGVTGLVIGLASSIGAIYRAGAHDAVLKMKDLIVSWIPHMDSLAQNSGSYSGRSQIVLSVGSCLSLPMVVAFCQRVELLDANELNHLVNGYRALISELLSVNKSGSFHKSLLMASCIGAGSLLACILNEGVHSIEVEHVNCFLELFRKCYSNAYPPIIHFGGMLGVVNAFGAGSGDLICVHPLPPAGHTVYKGKEYSYISGPLLMNPVCEQHLTSLIQDMFLVAQNSDDHQLQHYAAWAVSFLRYYLLSGELQRVDNGIQADVTRSKPVQGVPEDSVVMKLGLWLTHLSYSGTGSDANVGTVATVLRCLSRAPRLPTLDWAAIVRWCMRYEAQVAELLPPESILKERTLREECLHFSLAHASQFDALLTFLDELSDLSRFRTLELNLQSCLLFHLADLLKVFSGSRLEKLFDDIAYYLASLTSNQVYNSDQKSWLRISCWRGFYQCQHETSLDSVEYISNIEKCMEVLFSLLPASQSTTIIQVDQVNSVNEWSEAVRCLGKSRQGWLFDFLQVQDLDHLHGDAKFSEVEKKILAKAKLVRTGCIPLTELGRIKAYILNCESFGIWDVLIEVVAALQNVDASAKKQWLVDAVEISCVSRYPSTALLFVALLSGSCCKYMPLLILDRSTLLNDLPVTITSLLLEPGWEAIAKTFVSYLWASMQRIYSWVTQAELGEDSPSMQPIDASENDTGAFLLRVMHQICVWLREYLPLEKQLKLANMVMS